MICKVLKCVFLLLIIFYTVPLSANGLIDKEKKRYISLDLELNTKYVWRGLEYGDSPIMFSKISFTNSCFSAYGMGGYALNGSHQEVDFGFTYFNKYLTICLSDYFYPSKLGLSDNYFDFSKDNTNHSLESLFILRYPKVPVSLAFSSYIYGNDKNINGKQAYSSYLELEYTFSRNKNILSFSVGSSLNKSFYTDYKKKISIVNCSFKYLIYLSIGEYIIPTSVTWMFNPYKNKTFFSFSTYITI